MPTTAISPGPVTPITQNIVYALPGSPCMITSGVTIQRSTVFTGPFTDWAGGRNDLGGWIKCVTGNTTVQAVKIKMKDL